MPSKKIKSIQCFLTIAVALFVPGIFFADVPITHDVARRNRISPTVVAVAQTMPSVVNLSTEKVIDSYAHDWPLKKFENLFDFTPEQILGERQPGYSLGSGSIIDASGLVVTNAHIVRRAVKINATLHDGSQHLAEVLAADDLNDIALLRIIGLQKPVSPIKTAAPGDLLLGETVIVVGNPYGLGSSISQGVLSAIGRKITHKGEVIFSDILQSSAPVFPGSSGGPLININGEIIGINTALLRNTRDIGFAIPFQRVENILARWLIPERFNDATLGIIPGVKRLSNGRLVYFIREILPDSPAADAGIVAETQITHVNGEPVDSLIDWSRLLWRLMADDELELQTDTGKTYKLKVRKMLPEDVEKIVNLKLGIKVQPLTIKIADALNYPFHGGLIISGLPQAGVNGVRRGDLLLRLGDVSINSREDLWRALAHARAGEKIPAELVCVQRYLDRYYLVKKAATFSVR